MYTVKEYINNRIQRLERMIRGLQIERNILVNIKLRIEKEENETINSIIEGFKKDSLKQ